MRVRFKGGPWDGVEFDATYHPYQIGFRDELTRIDEPVEGDDPLQVRMQSSRREHHQYLMNGMTRTQDGAEVMQYRYAPGEPVYWEE